MSSYRSFLMVLYREGMEGMLGETSWFVDKRAGAGLLATLDRFTAEEASGQILRGTGTVAAHAHHLRVSLQAAIAELRGEPIDVVWEDTWRRPVVDQAEWSQIRSDLASLHQQLISEFERASESDTLVHELGHAVAHCAWHLGAIRQLAADKVERQG